MALERCPNGHLYDPGKHTSCPYCGVADPDFGKTYPKRVANEPDSENTRPRGQGPAGGIDPGATVGIYQRRLGLDPVVGWLVCVEGRNRGRDYRIRSEKNFIGRSETMDIQIEGDPAVSRDNHAVLTFDPKVSVFKLSPGDSRGMVYLNGEAVFSPVDLHAYDQIQLGETQLMFVPFCGDAFQWT